MIKSLHSSSQRFPIFVPGSRSGLEVKFVTPGRYVINELGDDVRCLLHARVSLCCIERYFLVYHGYHVGNNIKKISAFCVLTKKHVILYFELCSEFDGDNFVAREAVFVFRIYKHKYLKRAEPLYRSEDTYKC